MLTKSVTNVSPPASKDVLPPGLGLRGPRVLPAGNAPAASSTGSRQSTPSPGSRRNDGGQIGIPIGQSQETNSSARLQDGLSNAASRSTRPDDCRAGSRTPEIPEHEFRQANDRNREPHADRRPVPAVPSASENPPSSPAAAPASIATLANLATLQPLPLDTEYLGPWLPRGSGSCLAAPRLLPPAHQRSRSLSASSSTSPSLGLLVIRAHADSGCSGSLTNNGGALINLRPCNERFKAADGLEYKATHIGDMPVVAKDFHGRPRRLEGPDRATPNGTYVTSSGAK